MKWYDYILIGPLAVIGVILFVVVLVATVLSYIKAKVCEKCRT